MRVLYLLTFLLNININIAVFRQHRHDIVSKSKKSDIEASLDCRRITELSTAAAALYTTSVYVAYDKRSAVGVHLYVLIRFACAFEEQRI